jgi:hypothetical protein
MVAVTRWRLRVSGGRFRATGNPREEIEMAWRLEGTYLENCSCEVVCPCTAAAFDAPADYDRCQALLTFHVDSGEVDGTEVSDRSVAVIVDSPKQMSDGNWRVGLFMDARASEEQVAKLASVFSGQLGGPMGNLAPLIGENLGMEVAPIEYSDDGRRHRVKIGDLIEIEVEDAASPFDPDGDPPRLTGTRHPANDTLVVARAVSSRVQGMGIEFSGDGKSGFSAPFSWSG